MNHPNVLPATAERIDVAPLVADPRNVVFTLEAGCLVFVCRELGRYELHIDFLEGYRGRYAREAAGEALRQMFLGTDCLEVEFKIAAANRTARWAAGQIGARREFDRAGYSFWRMTYADWLYRQPDLVDAGRVFVVDVASECARLGSSMRDFLEDDDLFRRLGAVVETLGAGQIDKGVALYDRWASLALAPEIVLVARLPLMICFGGAVLVFTGRSVRAVRCL